MVSESLPSELPSDTPPIPKRPSRRPTRDNTPDTSAIAPVVEPIVREHDRAVAAVEEDVPETVLETEEAVAGGGGATGATGAQDDPIDLDGGDGDAGTTDKVPVVPSRRPKRDIGDATGSTSSTKSSLDDTANVGATASPSFMPTPVTEATYDEPSFNAKPPKQGMTTEEAASLEHRQAGQDREGRQERDSTPSIPARPSRPARRPVGSSTSTPVASSGSEQGQDIEGPSFRPTPVEGTSVEETSVETPVVPSRRPGMTTAQAATLEHKEEDEFKAASTPFQPIEPTVPERPQRPSSRPKKSPLLTATETDEALEQRIARGKEMGIEVGLGPMDKPVARGVPKDDMALLHDSLSAVSDPSSVRTGPPIKAAVPKDDIALMMEGQKGGVVGDEVVDVPTSVPGNPRSAHTVPLDSVALKQKHDEEDEEDDDKYSPSHRKVPLDAVAMEEKRKADKEEDKDESAPVGLDDVALEERKEEEKEESERKSVSAPSSAEPRIPARPSRPTKRPSASASASASATASVENLSAAREATLDLSKENPVPLADEEEEVDAIIEPASEKPVVGVGAAEKEIEEMEREEENDSTPKSDVAESEEKDVSTKSSSRKGSVDNATPIAAATSSVTTAAAAATAGIAAAAASVAAAVTGDGEGNEDAKDDAKDDFKDAKYAKDEDKHISEDTKDAKSISEDTPHAKSPLIPARPKPVSRTGSNLSGKSPLIPPRPMKRPGNNTSSSSLGAGLSSDNLALSDGAEKSKPESTDAKPVTDTAKPDESISAPPKPAKRPPPVKPKPKIGAAFQAALEEKDKEFKPKPRVPVRSNKISALAKGLDGMFGAGGGPMVFGAPMPKKEVEEEEEVSEAGGGAASHDLPPIGVDKEEKTKEEEPVGASSRRGRVKGPKRKLPSSAVSPWSCSVISDVWELVPKVKEVVEDVKEKTEGLSRDLETKSRDLEKKIEAHHHDARAHDAHAHDSSDDDFEDAREHVQHDKTFISSVGNKDNNDAHVHAVPRRLSAALDAAGHPTTHVDVVRDGKSSTDLGVPDEKSVSEAEKAIKKTDTEPSVPARPSRRPKDESDAPDAPDVPDVPDTVSEPSSQTAKAPSPVDTTSTSVHKDIPAPVDHTSIGNPENALYDTNDDVARFSTSEKPLYTASEPDVIKSATHHHPYEVGSVSEPDVIKSATHHMKEQPFSEAVDVEAAIEAAQAESADVETSPTSVYSPAPTSAIEESPIDRKQSVGSIIGGYLDSPTKEVETIEEDPEDAV